mmetsp:Transcript_16437/g.51477  ORF Transcript_16437/g.51477 Transcript_16437/m.51477 type:complete len:548 (+) Transcript_16437:328-1971(+)
MPPASRMASSPTSSSRPSTSSALSVLLRLPRRRRKVGDELPVVAAVLGREDEGVPRALRRRARALVGAHVGGAVSRAEAVDEEARRRGPGLELCVGDEGELGHAVVRVAEARVAMAAGGDLGLELFDEGVQPVERQAGVGELSPPLGRELGELAAHARDVDEACRAALLCGGLEERRQRFGETDRAPEIRCESRRRLLGERRRVRGLEGDRRVVHEDVDRAVLVGDPRGERVDARLGREVELFEDAPIAKPLGRRLAPRRVAAGHDQEAHRRQQLLRDGEPDPLVRPGHHRQPRHSEHARPSHLRRTRRVRRTRAMMRCATSDAPQKALAIPSETLLPHLVPPRSRLVHDADGGLRWRDERAVREELQAQRPGLGGHRRACAQRQQEHPRPRERPRRAGALAGSRLPRGHRGRDRPRSLDGRAPQGLHRPGQRGVQGRGCERLERVRGRLVRRGDDVLWRHVRRPAEGPHRDRQGPRARRRVRRDLLAQPLHHAPRRRALGPSRPPGPQSLPCQPDVLRRAGQVGAGARGCRLRPRRRRPRHLLADL